MDPSSTAPDIDSDRVAALVADATDDNPLSAEGQTSLARAVERLPEALAQSEIEAVDRWPT